MGKIFELFIYLVEGLYHTARAIGLKWILVIILIIELLVLPFYYDKYKNVISINDNVTLKEAAPPQKIESKEVLSAYYRTTITIENNRRISSALRK